MHSLTRNRCQKLGDFINQYTIHVTLHWAEKVMIKALYISCLVDQEDDNATLFRSGISYSGIDYESMLQSHFRIIS